MATNFDDRIDELNDELDLLQEQEALVIDRNNAQIAFESAKAALESVSKISQTVSTGYMHNGMWVVVSNKTYQAPDDVNFYVQNGVPWLSVQFFSGKNYQDIKFGEELSGYGLDSNNGIPSGGGQLQEKRDEIMLLFEDAAAKYIAWQELVVITQDFGSLSSIQNKITTKQNELDILAVSYAEFLASGLSPEEAGALSVERANSQLMWDKAKRIGLYVAIGIASIVALILLYKFMKKRKIIFK